MKKRRPPEAGIVFISLAVTFPRAFFSPGAAIRSLMSLFPIAAALLALFADDRLLAEKDRLLAPLVIGPAGGERKHSVGGKERFINKG